MRPTLLAIAILASPFSLLAQQPSGDQGPASSTPGTPGPARPTDAQINAAGKAVADANLLLSNAKKLEVQVNTLINNWKSLPDTPATTAEAIQTLEGIYQSVSDGADGPGLRSKLSSMSDSLKKQGDTLASKQKDLLVGDATTPTDDVKDLFNQCDAVSKDIAAEKTTLDSLATSFADPVKRNYAFFTASFNGIDSSLAGLLNLKNQADPLDPARVRQVLAAQLSVFASQNNVFPKLRQEWENKFKPRLSTFFASADEASRQSDPVDAARDQVKTDIQSIPAKFCSWFPALTKLASDQTSALNTDKSKMTADYAGNYDTSVADDTKTASLLDSLKKVSDAWDNIVANPPDFSAGGCQLEDATAAMKSLRDNLPPLSTARVALADILSGNRSAWVADQVRLYYFTDVERLLEILNPNASSEGGTSEAAEKATAARKDLLNADLTLSDAQATVNKYQNQLINLKEQLRQAQAQQKSSSFLFDKTSGLVNTLTARLSKAQNDATQKNGDLTSSDPLKRAVAEQAKTKADGVNSQLESAKQANDNAQKDRDAAQQNLNTLQDQQQGLPAQIAAAQSALEAAQATVNRLRNAAIVAAQEESDAFAAARDHTPHIKTTAIPGSSDPAHRAEIYGFTDSKTIFIRGTKEDVEKVKQIINQFDQPAPQARITLWSLQLNSAGDRNNASTKRFNQALELVETELSNNRALVAASLSLFRDAINSQVSSTQDCNDAPKPEGITADEAERIHRMYCFYNKQVLNALGLRPENADFPTISKWTLPDPAGTTTLGEGLMILSLGKRGLRQKAWNTFTSGLKQRLDGLHLRCSSLSHEKTECQDHDVKTPNNAGAFSLTARALDLDTDRTDDGLTPAQLEIIHGLESWSLKRIIDRAEFLFAELDEVQSRLNAAKEEPVRRPLQTRMKTLNDELTPLAAYLFERAHISFEELVEYQKARTKGAANISEQTALTQFTGKAVELAKKSSSYLESKARVAAADEMLKEMMIAVEDDLDRLFVHPMTVRLRDDLVTIPSLNVGVLQKSSLLATNRLVARVDPRASAQLGLGQETDILQSLLQLGEVFVAAKTGGPLGALNALNAEKREAPPEIYSLNTGSQFKVIPIFDPSGQALRFKFDYVSGTQIQEPNGTTNPQLPRIERHTVNTEVQISNMEMREISRFESNSKLGIPTTYWGGVPIFKDIPYFRPWVPLLGWFVRHSGHDAASQESIIFGQTTIYPTIGDLLPLLASSASPEENKP